MEVIIQTGGRQYKVKQGQKLVVNKIAANIDSEVSFDVLMAHDGDKIQVGSPTLPKAKVAAKVVRHAKGDKVTSATYKRRKGFHKKKGHRQQLTEIEIKSISL